MLQRSNTHSRRVVVSVARDPWHTFYDGCLEYCPLIIHSETHHL